METVETNQSRPVEEALSHVETAKDHFRQGEVPETQTEIDMALRELQRTTLTD